MGSDVANETADPSPDESAARIRGLLGAYRIIEQQIWETELSGDDFEVDSTPSPWNGPALVRLRGVLCCDLDTFERIRLRPDTETWQRWDPSMTQRRVLDRWQTRDDDGAIAHEINHIDIRTGLHPWIASRDLVYHSAFLEDAEARWSVASSIPLPEDPLPRTRVRARLLLAVGCGRPTSMGQVEYTSCWSCDMGGRLPAFVVHQGCVRAQANEFRALQRILAEY